MKKNLVVNDSYFLTDIIFSDLKNDTTDVISLKSKETKKSGYFFRFYEAVLERRFYPLFMFLFFSLKRRYGTVKNIEYSTVLLVGIEDLSKLIEVYTCYFGAPCLYFWQWNPSPKKNFIKKIDFWIRLKIIKCAGLKVITFDKHDADKYELIYHPQIYSSTLSNEVSNKYSNYQTQAVFLGEDKGRSGKLSILDTVLNELNVNVDFKIIAKHKNDAHENKGRIQFKNEVVSYYDYLKVVCESSCIIDLVQEGQAGITLRVLEALFFKKKLITNNANIVEYDFYDDNNVLIIDFDDAVLNITSQVNDFLNKPYVSVSKEILMKYDVKSLMFFLTNIDI